VIHYKKLQPSEASLLVAAIENVYGSTYPIPEFYDANFVSSAIESQLLHCVVAITDEHRVVASMSTALERLGDVTADGSALMVDPEFRGRGIVAGLGENMVATYQALNLGGLHLYALALHDLVQNQSGKAGAVVTGILPAWFSRHARIEGYDYPDVRIGAVTLFMPLGSMRSRACYLPPCYENVLRELYGDLALERTLVVSDASAVCGEYTTHYRSEAKRQNAQVRIVLERIGSDVAERLADCKRMFEDGTNEVMYIDVPLGDPVGATAVVAARALGFFFGALMIDRCGDDHLRMQHYHQKSVATDAMVLASEKTKALLEFIVADSDGALGSTHR